MGNTDDSLVSTADNEADGIGHFYFSSSLLMFRLEPSSF